MPSLDRVDIRESTSRTEMTTPNKSDRKRQDLADNGNFKSAILGSNESSKSHATELDQAIENVAGYVQNIARDISFSVDAKTSKTIVRVTDQDSGELIRQIPNEEMLEISRSLEEAQQRNSENVHKGLLFEGDA